MKLWIKQLIFLTVIAFTLIFVLGIVIPFLGQQLSNYEVSDILSENNNLLILFGVVLHYFAGFYIHKFKSLSQLKTIYIVLFFLLVYLSITTLVRLNSGLSPSFYLLEMSLIIGLSLGILTYRSKNIITKSLLVLCTIFFLVFTFYITIPLTNQIMSYGNYSGKADLREVETLSFRDSNDSLFEIPDQKSKIIVLDFWINNCAVCFRQFPDVKNLQNEYRNNDKVEIIAVNVITKKEDIIIGERLLNQTSNSDLVNYYMEKELTDIFDIKWYPKVVVIKNNKITFEGNLETLLMFKSNFLE